MTDVSRLLGEATLPQPAILTGGSGRLGTELQALLPTIKAPSSTELDMTGSLDWLQETKPNLIVHAAAFTDVAAAEQNRQECWNLNVIGTRKVAQAAAQLNARLILISTDYVFSGDTGNYREDDPPGPVRNYYALSKLVAEEAARAAMPAGRLLIIRTSFRAREWPHPQAFSDLYTSQDYVDVLAPHIALAIAKADDIPFDTLHIAGRRRSALELARERRPEVEPASRASANVELPADISLNTDRWQQLLQRFAA